MSIEQRPESSSTPITTSSTEPVLDLGPLKNALDIAEPQFKFIFSSSIYSQPEHLRNQLVARYFSHCLFWLRDFFNVVSEGRLSFNNAIIIAKEFLHFNWLTTGQGCFGYMVAPHFPINQVFLALAQSVALVTKESVCQLLMPSVKFVVSPNGFDIKEETESRGPCSFHLEDYLFIPHASGDILLPVIPLLEHALRNNNFFSEQEAFLSGIPLHISTIRHALRGFMPGNTDRCCDALLALMTSRVTSSSNERTAASRSTKTTSTEIATVGPWLYELTNAMAASAAHFHNTIQTPGHSNQATAQEPDWQRLMPALEKFYKNWMTLSEETRNKVGSMIVSNNHRGDVSLESYLLMLFFRSKSIFPLTEKETARVISEDLFTCIGTAAEFFYLFLRENNTLFPSSPTAIKSLIDELQVALLKRFSGKWTDFDTLFFEKVVNSMSDNAGYFFSSENSFLAQLDSLIHRYSIVTISNGTMKKLARSSATYFLEKSIHHCLAQSSNFSRWYYLTDLIRPLTITIKEHSFSHDPNKPLLDIVLNLLQSLNLFVSMSFPPESFGQLFSSEDFKKLLLPSITTHLNEIITRSSNPAVTAFRIISAFRRTGYRSIELESDREIQSILERFTPEIFFIMFKDHIQCKKILSCLSSASLADYAMSLLERYPREIFNDETFLYTVFLPCVFSGETLSIASLEKITSLFLTHGQHLDRATFIEKIFAFSWEKPQNVALSHFKEKEPKNTVLDYFHTSGFLAETLKNALDAAKLSLASMIAQHAPTWLNVRFSALSVAEKSMFYTPFNASDYKYESIRPVIITAVFTYFSEENRRYFFDKMSAPAFNNFLKTANETFILFHFVLNEHLRHCLLMIDLENFMRIINDILSLDNRDESINKNRKSYPCYLITEDHHLQIQKNSDFIITALLSLTAQNENINLSLILQSLQAASPETSNRRKLILMLGLLREPKLTPSLFKPLSDASSSCFIADENCLVAAAFLPRILQQYWRSRAALTLDELSNLHRFLIADETLLMEIQTNLRTSQIHAFLKAYRTSIAQGEAVLRAAQIEIKVNAEDHNALMTSVLALITTYQHPPSMTFWSRKSLLQAETLSQALRNHSPLYGYAAVFFWICSQLENMPTLSFDGRLVGLMRVIARDCLMHLRASMTLLLDNALAPHAIGPAPSSSS
jgi:hypothetical protein